MQIVFNIAENSTVEVVKGEYALLQGECCVTELKFNFPETIRGVAIGNYKRRIEFGECKELGECAKFIDDINGDTYELGEQCTAFKKIIVQVVLTYDTIKWKTKPVVLEFEESVNAEGNTVIQAQILTLEQIEREWENYIKANTFRVVYSASNVPTADAASLGETIFYLGPNTNPTPLLIYGHYYRCNYVDGVYEWTDLTQDPSLEGVANGFREVNKNQTLQAWVGTTDEYNALTEEEKKNVLAIVTDDETAVPLAAQVEHLYLHSAKIVFKGTVEETTVVTVFTITYTDTSDTAKAEEWYKNQVVFGSGATIFTNINHYTDWESGIAHHYCKIEFIEEDGEYKATMYDALDNNLIMPLSMVEVDVEVAPPFKIR